MGLRSKLRRLGIAPVAFIALSAELAAAQAQVSPPAPSGPPAAGAPPAETVAAPPLAGPTGAAPSTPSSAGPEPGADEPTPEVVVRVERPISAASSFEVRERELELRPIGSVQDILRVTPGLVVVQHSGGGKANQYFIRGFDADHGTDLALSIDGVPINLVSHAHGQGFSDTSFIIPEVVERVEITKGPYFVSQGDFATAGAVNLVSRRAFEQSSVSAGLSGSPGHGGPGYRGLAIVSPRLESTRALFAAEIGRSDGPFENPERWDRYKLFSTLSFGADTSEQLTLGQLSYAASWNGSGQIPDRALQRGLISRFGSLDPDEGGNTARHQIFARYRRLLGDGELEALAYAGRYRLNLFSNFTLYLNDPVSGDEIEQVDRRTFFGARTSYRVVHELAGVRFDTSLGADARNDDIHGELWSTASRARRVALRSHDIHETFVGAFINGEIEPLPWLRANLGARADLVTFAVDDRLTPLGAEDGPGSGAGAGHQLSPKASLIAAPLETETARVELYANYGHGFHSNDVRGVFVEPRVTPLTRAIGYELGARARLFGRWDLAGALWRLDLDNEIVWVGDEGTTEVGDATRRQGLELETRYELTPWLAADLDVTFTRAVLREAPNSELALAAKQTWSGGVSARHPLGPGTGRAGLRFYGIGDRPASDDGALMAPGFTQLDLHVGYRHSRFDVALDVENLLDGVFRSAQFATVSRLPDEPAIGAPLPAGFGCGRGGRLAAPDGAGFAGCEEVKTTRRRTRCLCACSRRCTSIERRRHQFSAACRSVAARTGPAAARVGPAVLLRARSSWCSSWSWWSCWQSPVTPPERSSSSSGSGSRSDRLPAPVPPGRSVAARRPALHPCSARARGRPARA